MLSSKFWTVRNIFFDRKSLVHTEEQSCDLYNLKFLCKGHPPSADLRYGEEDSISPPTQMFASTKG